MHCPAVQTSSSVYAHVLVFRKTNSHGFPEFFFTSIIGLTLPPLLFFFFCFLILTRKTGGGSGRQNLPFERFLGSGFDYRGQDFEFIPFGVGRSICPAVGFATANIELVLAQLLHSFDWELPFGMRVEDMDMSGFFGLAMPRASELLVVARCV